MSIIENFTNEEKLLYSCILDRILIEAGTNHFTYFHFNFNLPNAVEFKSRLTECLMDFHIHPDIFRNAPLSKYVWKNMSADKQQYVLRRLQYLVDAFSNSAVFNRKLSTLFRGLGTSLSLSINGLRTKFT